MGRSVRETKLENRSSRLRLPARPEPYWRVIHEGAHLGYYRGARIGKWVARFRESGTNNKVYLKTTLGEADDVADADGDRFLDFRQAQDRARSWFEEVASSAHSLRTLGPHGPGILKYKAIGEVDVLQPQ